MKILHIAPDEKFIESMYWQFEQAFPNASEFIIVLQKEQQNAKYVVERDTFQIIKDSKEGVAFCLNKILDFDVVIFHGLTFFQSKVVLKCKQKNKLVWFFWGGELYDNPKALKAKTIGPKSTATFEVRQDFKRRIKGLIRPFYYRIFQNAKTPELNILKAARVIPNFGIVHEEELRFLQSETLLHPKAKQLKMTYYPLEFIFKDIEDTYICGNDILIGNSASITNNHLEVFDILKPFTISEEKIIVPLSYGDTGYAARICEEGEKTFGTNFYPLNTFMSLPEYNKIIQQCRIVIMNHYRQQAVGNIVALLWMGAKVYLDERNTFYQYLKRIGVGVYSISADLRPENLDAFKALEVSEVTRNRAILRKEISFDVLKENLKSQLTTLVKEIA